MAILFVLVFGGSAGSLMAAAGPTPVTDNVLAPKLSTPFAPRAGLVADFYPGKWARRGADPKATVEVVVQHSADGETWSDIPMDRIDFKDRFQLVPEMVGKEVRILSVPNGDRAQAIATDPIGPILAAPAPSLGAHTAAEIEVSDHPSHAGNLAVLEIKRHPPNSDFVVATEYSLDGGSTWKNSGFGHDLGRKTIELPGGKPTRVMTRYQTVAGVSLPFTTAAVTPSVTAEPFIWTQLPRFAPSPITVEETLVLTAGKIENAAGEEFNANQRTYLEDGKEISTSFFPRRSDDIGWDRKTQNVGPAEAEVRFAPSGGPGLAVKLTTRIIERPEVSKRATFSKEWPNAGDTVDIAFGTPSGVAPLTVDRSLWWRGTKVAPIPSPVSGYDWRFTIPKGTLSDENYGALTLQESITDDADATSHVRTSAVVLGITSPQADTTAAEDAWFAQGDDDLLYGVKTKDPLLVISPDPDSKQKLPDGLKLLHHANEIILSGSGDSKNPRVFERIQFPDGWAVSMHGVGGLLRNWRKDDRSMEPNTGPFKQFSFGAKASDWRVEHGEYIGREGPDKADTLFQFDGASIGDYEDFTRPRRILVAWNHFHNLSRDFVKGHGLSWIFAYNRIGPLWMYPAGTRDWKDVPKANTGDVRVLGEGIWIAKVDGVTTAPPNQLLSEYQTGKLTDPNWEFFHFNPHCDIIQNFSGGLTLMWGNILDLRSALGTADPMPVRVNQYSRIIIESGDPYKTASRRPLPFWGQGWVHNTTRPDPRGTPDHGAPFNLISVNMYRTEEAKGPVLAARNRFDIRDNIVVGSNLEDQYAILVSGNRDVAHANSPVPKEQARQQETETPMPLPEFGWTPLHDYSPELANRQTFGTGKAGGGN